MATNAWVELPLSVVSLNGLSGAVSLIAGTNVTITPSGNNLTIAATGGGGGGSVTSVALADSTGLFTISGSPVTSTGTLTLASLNSQTQNTFFAAPNGSNGAPTFRTIVAADVPTLNQNTTGTAANITATSNSTLTTLSSLNLPASQVTGLTSGSVVYSNGTSLAQDNANFFWSDANVALGIGGTPQAASVLTTVNSSGVAKPIWSFGYGTGSINTVRGDFARGSSGAPTAAQTGDAFNVFSGRGYGTSQFPTASTGNIGIYAAENFTNTSNATYVSIKTTPTGSVTNAERIRVNSTGNILINTTTDNATDLVQSNGGISSTYSKLQGASSGYIEQQASSTTTSYNVIWPAAQGGVNTVPVNNGSGTLSWNAFPSPYTVSTISSNTNAVSGTTYLCNTSGAAFTLTLPAPVSGAFVAVKDSTGSFQTNQLTVAPHAGEMIEGLATSKVLYTSWGAFSFFSDGTNWFMGPF
jgi:hypothetical protein